MSEATNTSKLGIVLSGIIKENPVLVLVLGTCPTLATTTSVSTALGMGAATTVVLICSNILISMLRKVIPETVIFSKYILRTEGKDKSQNGAAITIISASRNCSAHLNSAPE